MEQLNVCTYNKLAFDSLLNILKTKFINHGLMLNNEKRIDGYNNKIKETY